MFSEAKLSPLKRMGSFLRVEESNGHCIEVQRSGVQVWRYHRRCEVEPIQHQVMRCWRDRGAPNLSLRRGPKSKGHDAGT